MARKDYGTSLNTALTNKTTSEISADGAQIRVEKFVNTASVNNNVPALGSALAGNPGYALRRVQKEGQPAGITKLILIYDSSTSTGSLPANTIVEQGCVEEIDIKLHPDFAEWEDEWDAEKEAFLPTSSKYGITSYPVGTTTVTKTIYSTSQPASVHTSLGTLQSPGGGYGSSQNWLIIGAVRRNVGSYWATEITYKYSNKDYDTDIF